MVLGFKERFVGRILSGVKIHTIREDGHNRWRVGRRIEFATGVRTKNYTRIGMGDLIAYPDALSAMQEYHRLAGGWSDEEMIEFALRVYHSNEISVPKELENYKLQQRGRK